VSHLHAIYTVLKHANIAPPLTHYGVFHLA
jgi:hypothetical protein